MHAEMIDEPVEKYTNKNMTLVENNLSITNAAKVLLDAKSDSVLVFRKGGDIIGIITIKDIIADVVARGIDPHTISAEMIASKPLITIHKDSQVRDAIALMRQHDIRRLIVTDDERPIGLITQKVLVGNMGSASVELPELELPEGITCPYCRSPFDKKDALSRHIDDIHIGKGILEGNVPR